jgi:hypothetical protein
MVYRTPGDLKERFCLSEAPEPEDLSERLLRPCGNRGIGPQAGIREAVSFFKICGYRDDSIDEISPQREDPGQGAFPLSRSGLAQVPAYGYDSTIRSF